MNLWVLLVTSLLLAGQTAGQETKPQLVFRYVAAGPQVPSYIFRVSEDGSGSFHESFAGPDGALQESAEPLRISSSAVSTLLSQAKTIHDGGFVCASKAKGIANTGMKTLEFGDGSCTYNFSEEKTVVALTSSFQGMALTLDEGRKLAFKSRYDRLGLNDEMTILWDAVRTGRATEMGNIAPVLTHLANDEDVMERVRLRAASLLKLVQPANGTAAPSA